MEEKKITIYSYAKVWKVEKKIYNIGNIVFPVPVDLWSAVYFAASAFAVYILQKIFPVIMAVPVLVRLGMLPYGIMYVMRRTKVDGKNPVKYFAGYSMYLLCDRYSYLERFNRYTGNKERLILDWNCSAAYCRPSGKGFLRRKGNV